MQITFTFMYMQSVRAFFMYNRYPFLSFLYLSDMRRIVQYYPYSTMLTCPIVWLPTYSGYQAFYERL